MLIHPREKRVNEAELDLHKFLVTLREKKDLTQSEYLRVVINALSSAIQSIAKWQIREERHPDDPDKPGGLL